MPGALDLSGERRGDGRGLEAAKANGNVFDYSKPLKGIEVVDSHTFRIHLIKPYPQILYWMAMHFTTPVAREAVEYYDGKEHPDGPNGQKRLRPEFKWHPVSTGPYRIYEHEPNASYRLVANPNYTATTFPTDGWPPEKEALLRPLAGKKLPLIDEVQLPIIREQLPAFLLTRQGYLDRVAVGKDAFNSVVTASLDLAPEYKERGVSLEKDVTLSTFYISLNTQDPVLGPNKKLRQALSASFDARGWVDIFYNGVAEVAQQLVAPGIYGFQKDFKNPYGYNLEKARQLMVEAGYPNGIDPQDRPPARAHARCRRGRFLAAADDRVRPALHGEAGHQSARGGKHLRAHVGEGGPGELPDGLGHGLGGGLPGPGELLLPLLQQELPARGEEHLVLQERRSSTVSSSRWRRWRTAPSGWRSSTA